MNAISGAASGDPAGDLETALARVLQAGSYLSIGLVAIGTALVVASGASPLGGGPPLDLGSLAGDVLALRPTGLLWIGILGVLATPALRVVGALIGFARRGERGMVAVAVAILIVVSVGVIAGLVTG